MHFFEHPMYMNQPTDPLKPMPLPQYLTRIEQKKLRRQKRREEWMEKPENIRLSVVFSLKPKLRTSGLVRVLGTESVQEAMKMEAQVRVQMAKRQKVHEETNICRKLTADQKRDEIIRKIK